MNKKRSNIHKKMGGSLAAVLLLALAACTAEPPMDGNPDVGTDMLRVSLVLPESEAVPSSRATADENRMDKVVVLVFNADGTKLETVKSIGIKPLDADQTQWVANKTLLVGHIMKPTLAKRIYVMANWALPAGFDPDTYTETQLKAETRQIATLADINGTNAYPIPMSGSKEVASLVATSYQTEVLLTRQVAKVNATFTISAQTQNLLPGIRWEVDQMKISVRNLPPRTFTVDPKVVGSSALPPASVYLNNPNFAPDMKPAAGAQPTPPTQATQPLVWSKAFYTPENPVMATTDAEAETARATYLMVQLPYTENGVLMPDNYYLLYLRESTVPTVSNPYKVLRNHAYNIAIGIVGKGSPLDALQPNGNITPTIEVTPWHLADFNIEGGGSGVVSNFNVTRTRIQYSLGDNPAQDVIINTSVGAWQLVERGTNNVVLDFFNRIGVSTPVTKGAFTYQITTGSRPRYIVTVEQINRDDQTKYLFDFKAGKLRVPFTVSNDNSMIPNSVLTAAGWTTNLPTKGLQVATRGNGKYPGEMPEVNDPTKQWQTIRTSISGTPTGYGAGQSSTNAMIAANVEGGVQHPAANYCRSMGPEWYLPSSNELLLIYDKRNLLGPSYTFTINNYWTSTTSLSNTTYIVKMDPDYTGIRTLTTDRMSSSMTRCVRNIN